MRSFSKATIAAALAALALQVQAVPTGTLHSSNVGIGSMVFSVSGTDITIEETWTSVGLGSIEISGLEPLM